MYLISSKVNTYVNKHTDTGVECIGIAIRELYDMCVQHL